MGWRDAYERAAATPRAAVPPSTVVAERVGPDGARWRGVATSPVELHRDAGIDASCYAVARCIVSETGTADVYAALAVAETICNAAKLKGVTPYHWLVGLTSTRYEFTRWSYGEQRGRRASTRQDPDRRAVAIAEMAVNGRINFVGGAVSWFEPDLQDSGGYDERADQLAIRWAREDRLQWVGPLPGIDPYKRAAFLRKVAKGDKADPGPLLDVIARGRRGEPTMGPDSDVPGARAVDATGEPWWLLATVAALAVL